MGGMERAMEIDYENNIAAIRSDVIRISLLEGLSP